MRYTFKTWMVAAVVAATSTFTMAQNRVDATPEVLLESKRYYVDAARVYSDKQDVPENTLRAGINYYRAGRYDMALSFLHKADSLGLLKKAEDQFAYFQCLKMAKKYKEADAFITPLAAAGMDGLFKLNAGKGGYYEKISSYDGSRLTNHPANSEYSEFGPAVYNGSLYFNSTRPAESNKQVHRINMQPYYNLYGVSASNPNDAVFKPEGQFANADGKVAANGQPADKLPAGINQRYHDGPVFVTPSGNHLFFTSNWEGKKGHNNNARIRLNIYHSVKENGRWSAPVSLPFNGKNWSTQHAVFDEQTSVLYFSSNMPGGSGGFDIWTARLDDGKWSEARNLGEHVNTAANEVFPMISQDGGLLFSSNGWPGLGGLDIFLSDDPKRDAVNLLAGVNSEADDFQMHFDSKGSGYVVSNRSGGKGDDDIWTFTASLNDIRMANGVPVPVDVALRYNGFEKPKSADIEVKGKDETRLSDAADGNTPSGITAEEGATITARAAGFKPDSLVVNKSNAADGNVSMTLEPLSANQTAGDNLNAGGGSGQNNTGYSNDFESRSFEGLEGNMNGGQAVISAVNDKDQNVSLSAGQSLQTINNSMGSGTYAVEARSNDSASSQSLTALSDGTPGSGITLQVSPDGSKSEGWTLSSEGQILASGKDVPAKTGEWYEMGMTVRPDSVIAVVNGKTLGSAKNPAGGASGTQPGAQSGTQTGAQTSGQIVVSSVNGASQFDDVSYQPLGKMPRVEPGMVALLPTDKSAEQIADAVRSADGSAAAVAGQSPEGDALAGGLELIRREQPGYQEALVKLTGSTATPLSLNSKADELMPFNYQGTNFVSSGKPEGTSTAGTATGSQTGGYQLSGVSADGKSVVAGGAFGSPVNAAAGSATLPAGPDGKSYAGPVSVSAEGYWMVMSDGKGNLLYSKKEGSVWSTPAPFQHNGTGTNAGAGSQVVNNREGYFDEATSTMYFSSDRPGGQGGFDIWKSEWNGKGWSEPVNAGPMVNTAGDEVAPSTNGVQLLFSSNGWPGLGGQDAFVWQPGMVGPANMLRGVNSSSNDIGACVGADGKGFVSSNRSGGKGGYDVYQFKPDLAGAILAQEGLNNQSGISKVQGTAVTPLSVNSKADELMPFNYQGTNFVSTGKPEGASTAGTGAGSQTGGYQLSGVSADGKSVVAGGAFGSPVNAAAGSAGMLPAGSDGKSYAGPVSVSSEGNWIVLSDGKGNLSYSKKEGSVWSTPVPFQYNGTGSGSNAAAGSQGINNREGYFDEATSTMYFSSDRPGGQGGFDIWKSEWNGTGWSEPVNAGPMVNTAGDEVTPSTNGVQLLFSSNGWPGLGGQDAFVWKPGMAQPANMLRGVNSSSNDIGARIGADGKGFVSSDRAGGKGGYDVYQFKPDPAKIIVSNKGAGVSGDNGIADSEDYIAYGSVVGDLEGMAEDGEMLELEIAEPAGSPVAVAYRIVNGKLVTRKTVFTKDNRLRTVTIRGKDSRGRIITKVVVIWPAADKESGEWVIRLYYGSGKIGFREISFADANRIVRMLRSDPSLNLKIDVYTDCTGTEPGNLRISQNRAVWLVNYLNRRVPGSAGRIQATGHGETNLLVDCGCDGQALRCTRAQNNKNRRAEIRRVK